jgi:regulator of replication initiation timing
LPVEYSKKAAEKQQHLQKLENDLVKLQEENVLLKAENKKLNERVDLLLNKL